MQQSRIDRRKFLKMISAGTCGAALHNVLSPYAGMLAYAAPAGTAALMGPNPVFILVNLAGGASYNITPIYHGTFRDKMPTLSYSESQSIPLTPEQGLHPALSSLLPIYQEGKLALLNLVGYPNPNRSHAESTDIYFGGARQVSALVSQTGWAARLQCQLASSLSAISLGGTNLLIEGDCKPVPRSFGDLSNLTDGSLQGDTNESTLIRMTKDSMLATAPAPKNERQAKVRDAMIDWDSSVAYLGQYLRAVPSGASFPNTDFGRRCRDAARLLNSPQVPVRFIYLETGGYDTHEGERNALTSRLQELGGGLSALINAAKLANRWNDVCIVTMSEFSRTFENDSGGTDHGHAAPMFVIGGGVNGGRIVSPTPSVAQTNANGYYRDIHIHFVQVFSEVIRAMGYDAARVFLEPSVTAYPLNLF